MLFLTRGHIFYLLLFLRTQKRRMHAADRSVLLYPKASKLTKKTEQISPTWLIFCLINLVLADFSIAKFNSVVTSTSTRGHMLLLLSSGRLMLLGLVCASSGL